MFTHYGVDYSRLSTDLGYLAVPVGRVNFLTDSLRLFYGYTHRTPDSSRLEGTRPQCYVVQSSTVLQPPKLLQDFQYSNSTHRNIVCGTESVGGGLHFDA